MLDNKDTLYINTILNDFGLRGNVVNMIFMLLGLVISFILVLVVNPTVSKLFFVAIAPFFLFQFMDDLTGIPISGLNSGGKSSYLQIAICVMCSGVSLFLYFSLKNQITSRESLLHDFSILNMAWAGIFLLQIITLFRDSTRWVPLASFSSFLVTFFVLSKFGFELAKLKSTIVSWGLISAGVIAIGLVGNRAWNASEMTFTDTEFVKGTYFSPLSSILGLPVRNNFYFNAGPQIFGITFALLFTLSSTLDTKPFRYFASIVFLATGSLSGSRTFYLVVILLPILKVIFEKFNSLNLIIPKIFFVVVLVSLGYSYLSTFTSGNSNLSSVSGRSIIWNLIVSHWNDHSLLGNGSGTLQQFVLTQHIFFPFKHAHNSVLQYLWDYGLLGLLFSLTIVLLPMFKLRLSRFSFFTGTYIALLLIQTEITIEASVSSPFPLFWIAVTVQALNWKTFKLERSLT